MYFGDKAREDGTEARPAVSTAAEACGCCTKSVQRVLARWTALGLITIYKYADWARHRPNYYKFNLALIRELISLQNDGPSDTVSPGTNEESESDAPQRPPAGRQDDTRPCGTKSPNPFYTHPIPTHPSKSDTPKPTDAVATSETDSKDSSSSNGTNPCQKEAVATWKKAKKRIQDDLGDGTYYSWVKDLQLVSDDGETVLLRHPKNMAPGFIYANMKVMNALERHTRRRIKIIGPYEKIEWEEPKDNCSSAA